MLGRGYMDMRKFRRKYPRTEPGFTPCALTRRIDARRDSSAVRIPPRKARVACSVLRVVCLILRQLVHAAAARFEQPHIGRPSQQLDDIAGTHFLHDMAAMHFHRPR